VRRTRDGRRRTMAGSCDAYAVFLGTAAYISQARAGASNLGPACGAGASRYRPSASSRAKADWRCARTRSITTANAGC
jgi:hypothetical protein